MKIIKNVTLVSLAILGLVSCNDTYSSGERESIQQDKNAKIKVLDRSVNYLVDSNKKSLYRFDKDMLNISNCGAGCREIWPIFTGEDTTSEDIKTLDGTNHLAYRKHPLYFFASDQKEGDILGNNVQEVWHLIFPAPNSTDNQTQLSASKVEQTYLTDIDGRSLYTFDKDAEGVSNCYDESPTANAGCETIWPVFSVSDFSSLPTGTQSSDFAVIQRDPARAKEGESLTQTTYKGQPLYYFNGDNETKGLTNGDWVLGVWHLVETESTKYTAKAEADGEKVFTDPAKCASCHGADGTRPVGPRDVVLASNAFADPEVVAQFLKDMRDGNPNNRIPTMVNIAKGLTSDDLITNLSAYVSTMQN